MAETRGMTDEELKNLIRGHIDEAIGSDDDELSERREKALDFYRGDLTNHVEALTGRSTVTSHDLSDAVGWILPSLMRVFNNGDKIVEYEPSEAEDEPFARQATDYINYVFSRECQGYRVIYDACHEALLFGNGIIKHWWDDSIEYETENYSGLPDEAFMMLVEPDEVKVLQHSVSEVMDMETGMPVAVHDVKIRRQCRRGKIRVESVPPEEFLIEKEARSIEEANFVAHKRLATRASLIAQGFDRDKVMEIPTGSELDWSEEKLARWDDDDVRTQRSKSDPLMQEVEVHECYIRTDYDGDDWPEWRKVVLGGRDGAILANDEWDADVPFSDLCAMPQPHRWDGRSLFDEVEDIQKIKTVLLRQTLDNLYLQNLPQRAVMQNGVENPDELANPQFGGVVIEKIPGAVRDLVVPFVAQNSFAMLEYVDALATKRTGVSETSMALDPETLQNQSATASNNAQAAAYSKIELYARNLSVGLRRVFKCLLRLIIANQDKASTIRLRNEWVEMDPRAWNADMDATVNVGLGSGSRDRDIMMLTQILAQQKEIMTLAGPFNPVAGIDRIVNTMRKVVEAAGIRNPDAYFAEITPEEAKAWMQENMGGGDDEPSPEEKKAMAEMQLKQAEAQANLQMRQQEMQAKAQFDREKAAADIQTAREKHAMEMQAMRERAAAEMEIQREKARAEMQLRREEMMIEAELTQRANEMNAQVAVRRADTNIERPS